MELVFETVKREAERFGVSVGSSEIVGLIPERALEQAAEFFLQIENFKPAMVLENRLAEAISGTMIPAGDSIRGFIDLVASPEPAPGGGSVAALVGSLGTALGQMGIRISQKKKALQQHSERYADVLDRLTPYTSALLELVEADADSYTQVLHAYRLPKDSPGRDDAIQQAIVRATDIPARTATCAAEALRLLEDIRSVIYANVKPDFEVGLQMLRTSLRSAIASIRTNLVDIKDPDVRIRYEDMITGWEHMLKS
jgi:formiminotetrahydrofolate cyclodeaminase